MTLTNNFIDPGNIEKGDGQLGLNANDSIDEHILSFFKNAYPLVKLFNYGKDILIYDSKPHFVFIVSNEEMAVLIDYLKDKPTKDILGIHLCKLPEDYLKLLIDKFEGLKKNGVFIKGPVEEISPVDREEIREQLRYFDENILLRKFCLKVTDDCNYRCTYCKSTIAHGYQGHSSNNLSEEDACRGIDYYFSRYIGFFQKLTPENRSLLLEILPPGLSWYGGEPFLNFELMKKTADYFKSLPWDRFSIQVSDLNFSSNTNLSIMNEEILHFLVDNRVNLYASLDGPQEEHDRCRVFKNGKGTFHLAYQNLLKIKTFDPTYFKQRVAIFGVYTDQHQKDLCVEFTRNLGALRCQHFPAEYVGTFVPNLDSALDSYENSIPERLSQFSKKASVDAEDPDLRMDDYTHLYPFAKLNFDRPAGKNRLHILLTCPMGIDNLMVGANGDFFICHKVDDAMPIGNCRTGLDLEKLAEVNRQYNSAINNEECRSCWNVNFCTACAATRMADRGFINPSRKECDFFRLRTTYGFLCMIHLSLEEPDLLDRIFAYRNNRKNYIDVIDLHDFQKQASFL